MSRVPRYQKQQSIQGVGTSSLRGGEISNMIPTSAFTAGAMAYESAADTWGVVNQVNASRLQRLNSRMAEEAAMQAIRYDEQGNFMPVEFNPIPGAYAERYNDIVSRTYQSAVGNQARVEFARLQSENPLNPEGFMGAAEGYIDGLAEEAPESLREVIRGNLMLEATSAANALNIDRINRTRETQLATLSQDVEVNLDRAIDVASRGGDPSGLFALAEEGLAEVATSFSDIVNPDFIVEQQRHLAQRRSLAELSAMMSTEIAALQSTNSADEARDIRNGMLSALEDYDTGLAEAVGGSPVPGPVAPRASAPRHVETILTYATRNGVDPMIALAISAAETGETFDPTIFPNWTDREEGANRYGGAPNEWNYQTSRGLNGESSAIGLFQMIDAAWREMGGTAADRLDPNAQANLGTQFIAQNAQHLQRTLGRSATPGELYMAHALGRWGAAAALSAPDDTRLVDLKLEGGSAVISQGTIDSHNWPSTVGELRQHMEGVMDSRLERAQRFVNVPARPSEDRDDRITSLEMQPHIARFRSEINRMANEAIARDIDRDPSEADLNTRDRTIADISSYTESVNTFTTAPEETEEAIESRLPENFGFLPRAVQQDLREQVRRSVQQVNARRESEQQGIERLSNPMLVRTVPTSEIDYLLERSGHSTHIGDLAANGPVWNSIVHGGHIPEGVTASAQALMNPSTLNASEIAGPDPENVERRNQLVQRIGAGVTFLQALKREDALAFDDLLDSMPATQARAWRQMSEMRLTGEPDQMLAFARTLTSDEYDPMDNEQVAGILSNSIGNTVEPHQVNGVMLDVATSVFNKMEDDATVQTTKDILWQMFGLEPSIRRNPYNASIVSTIDDSRGFFRGLFDALPFIGAEDRDLREFMSPALQEQYVNYMRVNAYQFLDVDDSVDQEQLAIRSLRDMTEHAQVSALTGFYGTGVQSGGLRLVPFAVEQVFGQGPQGGYDWILDDAVQQLTHVLADPESASETYGVDLRAGRDGTIAAASVVEGSFISRAIEELAESSGATDRIAEFLGLNVPQAFRDGVLFFQPATIPTLSGQAPSFNLVFRPDPAERATVIIPNYQPSAFASRDAERVRESVEADRQRDETLEAWETDPASAFQ